MRNTTNSAYWALRVGLGATAFVAGLDKFTNKMVHWEKYLSPAAKRRLPMSGSTFMKLAGVVEMGVGAMILGRQTRVGSAICSAWLLGIAANLVTEQDYYDIAARDVNMAIGAYSLYRMAAGRERRRQDEIPDHEQEVLRRAMGSVNPRMKKAIRNMRDSNDLRDRVA